MHTGEFVFACVHVGACAPASSARRAMANLRTKLLDFGGFDSSRILILRRGIKAPAGASLFGLWRDCRAARWPEPTSDPGFVIDIFT